MPEQLPFIVSLDVGSSSVRALVFDASGQRIPQLGAQLFYEIAKTADGGVEADADELLRLTIAALDSLHEQFRESGARPAAVAGSAFWHSFLGVDAEGRTTTPILHLFDTRAGKEAAELAEKLDAEAVHQRTGCRLHTSYWPAKLLWIERARPEAFRATRRWMSFPEFAWMKLTGEAALSASMASGSGLWNQRTNAYDEMVLAALPVREDQLWPAERMDEAQTHLVGEYRTRWPLFDGIPWYPAYGDGACSNVGSGCVTPDRFCLMVGTSGAMRAVSPGVPAEIPRGLWCYKVDRERSVLGGALTNGGDVHAWMRRNLALPEAEETERALAGRETGEHGITLLPFFGGERSPYWRADLRGAMSGLSLATTPLDILQAGLEGVALSFASIFELMKPGLGVPKQVIASGGALLASRAWTQMMADALGVPLVLTEEKEASARGAALLAAERLGYPMPETPAGAAFAPRGGAQAAFQKLREKREWLFRRIFEEE